MKHILLSIAAASALMLAGCGQPAEKTAEAPAGTEKAEAAGGQMAPAFQLANANGEQVSLADFRGKTVVLEWTNEDCPYVKKHYSGAMQALQKEAVADGVVWLTIISSAPGEQGFVEGERAKNWGQRFNAGFTHLLVDPTGATGKAYGAKTTPDMRVCHDEVFGPGTTHPSGLSKLSPNSSGRPTFVSTARPPRVRSLHSALYTSDHAPLIRWSSGVAEPCGSRT